MSDIFCGIDFGTTNCSCAVMVKGQPVAVELDDESEEPWILQSKIYVNHLGKMLTGQTAVNQYLWDIANIEAKSPKRYYTGRQLKLIKDATPGGFGGIKMVDEIVEVDTSGRGQLLQSLKSVLANKIYQGTEVNVYKDDELHTHKYSLEDLLGGLMKKIKLQAEKETKQSIKAAVIGRPVRYVGSDADEKLALRRMKKIAKLAGLKQVKFEFEPVGAALWQGIDVKQDSRVLTFDFGGGTLDICIMKFPEKEVLAVAGRPIGGDLLNSQIFQGKVGKHFGTETTFRNGKMKMPVSLVRALDNWYSIFRLKTLQQLRSIDNLTDAADDQQPLWALKELVVNDLGFSMYQIIDESKIRLSAEQNSRIVFKGNNFMVEELITRKEFENLIRYQLEETSLLIGEALDQSGLGAEKIDYVITTGGSSKIPIFQSLLRNFFGDEKVIIGDSFTSVARGLAIRADEVFRSG